MPIVADAAVKVGADMSSFKREVQMGGDQAVGGLGQKLKGVFSPKNLAVAGVAGGIALAGAITAGLASAVKALIDIERLNAQTDAAIRSTGGVANVTRQDIEDLSESMESLTTIERETVQEAANMLLTFTKVHNEVGEGNDIFDQATEAAANMSVALGTDMTAAAMMVGKALNDPVKGMTAMTRAGIQFTEQQKEMIKAMVESGDLLGAQTIILAELETQFGGSAEAFANTTAGKIQRFQNDVGNMFESIILGAVKVSDALGDDPFEGFAMNFGTQGDRIRAAADVLGTDFETLRTRIETAMDETGVTFEEAMGGIEGEVANAKVAVLAETGAMMVGVGDAISTGLETEVKPEVDRMASMPTAALEAKHQSIRTAAYDSMVSYAAGLQDAQDLPTLAFDAAMLLVETRLTEEEEVMRLKGQLQTLSLAAGIATAEGDAALTTSINAAIKVVTDRLDELDATGYGLTVAQTFATGINNGYGMVRTAAGGLAAAVRGQIGVESEPKDHDSPLQGHMKWGGNFAHDITDGILAELGAGRAAANALAGALVPSFGGAVGGVGGTAGALGSLPTSSTPQGRTIVVNVNSVIPASSKKQLVDIGNAVGPALEDWFTRSGRFDRRPR